MEFQMAQPLPPPRPNSAAGEPRKVGIEVEFGDISAGPTAELVQRHFGGEIEEIDQRLFNVRNTSHGDYLIKLDTRYAHVRSQLEKDGDIPSGRGGEIVEEAARALDDVVGGVMETWMPTEIVAPPVPYPQIPEIDRLLGELRAHGAAGTQASVVYAFGVHLNIEIATDDADWLRAVLQAYLLSSGWLRRSIDLDASRELVPFIDAFPKDYTRKVVDPDYEPDLEGLIADYLVDNATRNRELDLLPLFAHLRPEQVDAAIGDPRVKPRPTFHYRLPNTDLEEADWSLAREWNRIVAVETLAEDRQALQEAARAWMATVYWDGREDDWPDESQRWLGPFQ
jgi:hypothetical protein